MRLGASDAEAEVEVDFDMKGVSTMDPECAFRTSTLVPMAPCGMAHLRSGVEMMIPEPIPRLDLRGNAGRAPATGLRQALLLASVCLAAIAAASGPSEPTYRGRTLSDWTRAIDPHVPVLAGHEPTEWTAIRHMGTNALVGASPAARARIYRCLSWLKVSAQAAIPAIRAGLRDPNGAVRTNAAYAAKRIAPELVGNPDTP